MAIKERKERERQDMRNLIIESATRLFLQHGYDKTSIRNIADDIEYSPATIYLYFKDKDEIFYIIHENAFHLLEKELMKHDVIGNPFERLRALGKTYIRFAFENPDYYDLMFIMRAPLTQIKASQEWSGNECTYNMLISTVTECIETKHIKTADPGLTAMTTWSFVHGLVSLYIRERMLVLGLDDQAVRKMLDASIDFYLSNLKT